VKRRILKTLIKALTLSLVTISGTGEVLAQQPPALLVHYPDTIFMNGKIVTLDNHEMNDDPGSIVEALAVRDAVIIALGSNDDIMALAGPGTEVIDLNGRMVLPGIVESHVHPQGSAEQIAKEMYNLRSTPEGYALSMDVAATPDETMVRVAEAMKLLLATVEPGAEEWINIELLHSPGLGFASPADVSTLMTSPRLDDVQISRSDISEIVPDYPFVLSSATNLLSTPEKNIWFHITVGDHGEPVTTPVVEFRPQ
jgi:hypothetical protein